MAVNTSQLLAWLVEHISSVPLIYTKTKAILEADGLVDRWAAFKELGDLVVPILDDLPTVASLSEHSAEATFEANGMLDRFREIKEILPALLEIIGLLRSIGVLKS